MTKRVYKYAASTTPGTVFVLSVQKGSIPRCGRLQYECPMFWFEVDVSVGDVESWAVTAVFTGQDLPDGMAEAEYVGTDIGDNGLVWHFYARLLAARFDG